MSLGGFCKTLNATVLTFKQSWRLVWSRNAKNFKFLSKYKQFGGITEFLVRWSSPTFKMSNCFSIFTSDSKAFQCLPKLYKAQEIWMTASKELRTLYFTVKNLPPARQFDYTETNISHWKLALLLITFLSFLKLHRFTWCIIYISSVSGSFFHLKSQ